jgi:Glycosyltransferase family 87
MNRSAEIEISARRDVLAADSHILVRAAILTVLWTAVTLEIIVLVLALPPRAIKWDYTIYYSSAYAMRQGTNPYTADLSALAKGFGFDLGKIYHATDPPTFLLCFEPLTLLSPHRAFWAWTAINALSFLVALILLLRCTPGLSRDATMAIAAIAILYPPVPDHLIWGQNKMLVLLMLVLMLRWMQQGRDAAAGWILAFASLLRAFPLLLAGYLLLTKRWRVLTHLIAGLVVGGLVTIAFVGVGRSFSFLRAPGYLTEQWREALPGNIAVGPSVSRLFWYFFGIHLSTTQEWVRRIFSCLAQLAVIAFTIKATLSRASDEEQMGRLFSLWIMAAILLSPTSWFYYLVLLTIPLVELSAAALHRGVSRRCLWTGVASYALAWAYYLFISMRSVELAAHPDRLAWRVGDLPIALLAYLSLCWFVVDPTPNHQAHAEPVAAINEMRARTAV